MDDNRIWQLVARKISGEANESELEELEQLLQDDPETAYSVDLFTNYFKATLQTKRTEEKKIASWQNHLQRFQAEFPQVECNPSIENPFKKSASAIYIKWFAIAASLVIAVSSVFYFVKYKPATQDELAANNTTVNEIKTMPGTRSKNVLPDGTTVWLNSESSIKYNADFGKYKREITIVGEAFFDVAHNANVPLTVHAKSVNIMVKGTAFNVRSYPESNKVETSLIRGSVELTTMVNPEHKVLLKPNQKVIIDTKADSLTTQADFKMKPEKVAEKDDVYHFEQLKESDFAGVMPEISWVQNRLVFDNELFIDVIARMEKWYNVEISITNKGLEQKRFSGSFEKENIVEALSALQFINHFDFEIKGNKIIIR